MKAVFLGLALAASTATTAGSQPARAPDQCKSDPAYHAYDFALGKWDVSRERDGVMQKTAEVEMTSVLNGCAVQEHWTVPPEKPTGNVNGMFAYSAVQKAYIYSFATDYANNNYFVGHAVRPGEILYITELETPEGVNRVRHWSLTLMPDGRLDERSVRSDDQGKSWTVEYDLYWKKRS